MLREQILTIVILSLILLAGCASDKPREALVTRQNFSGKSLVASGVVEDENGVCKAGYVFRVQDGGHLPDIRSWIGDDGIVSIEINGELARSSANAGELLLFHNKTDEVLVECENVAIGALAELKDSLLEETESRKPPGAAEAPHELD